MLERLLLKGSIVVRKAYCDWDRYKEFKAAMHEAAFELIEIPHVRQSGKNSADIRMVVDALDLCYTKPHVDTFVIISGDSDFSPLVAKLRENNKLVIGVGVKNSTSDLLTSACDEFIYYDDLVRAKAQKQEQKQKQQQKRPAPAAKAAPAPAAASAPAPKAGEDQRKQEAIDLVVETMEALQEEGGHQDRIRASQVGQALKRRRPEFRANAQGFRSFGAVLEEAQRRGLLRLSRDERSGDYVIQLGP